MIGFILLSNHKDRELQSEMFNDQIMMMYMVISIYLFAVNKPFWSSLLLTVALSVKAGVVLLLPAFAGSL